MTVRIRGGTKRILLLEYEFFAKMAKVKMLAISALIVRVHGTLRNGMHHRVCDLWVGDGAVVLAARHAGVMIVPRGAGTGLSGGTIACGDAFVVATTRLRTIVSIDRTARVAIVEPGVPNLSVSAAAREAGLFFAPDPASQRISTIGGNVATNAGGPHALRYGAMVNHVLGIELVLPNGETERFGGDVADLPGFDCVPLIVGSEGTLGIITKIWLRLLPLPEDVRTFVAIFADIDSGARAASAIIATGVVPAAMEMLDEVTIAALNEAFEVHLPADAGSLLLVEVEGLAEENECG